jgi:LPXTG-motif cell wall-anchored protein
MEAVMDDPIILIAVFMVIALIAWYILRRRKSG